MQGVIWCLKKEVQNLQVETVSATEAIGPERRRAIWNVPGLSCHHQKYMSSSGSGGCSTGAEGDRRTPLNRVFKGWTS